MFQMSSFVLWKNSSSKLLLVLPWFLLEKNRSRNHGNHDHHDEHDDSHESRRSQTSDHKENMGGVFAKYSVQAVAWLFSKKSGLFFGISRFKKIDTVS